MMIRILFSSTVLMMGPGEENLELCGKKVLTLDQVLTGANTKWRKSYDPVKNEAKQVLQVSVPGNQTPKSG
jgi:hypothetical protein